MVHVRDRRNLIVKMWRAAFAGIGGFAGRAWLHSHIEPAARSMAQTVGHHTSFRIGKLKAPNDSSNPSAL